MRRGPSITTKIEQVTLKRSECLSVWLDAACDGTRDAKQVELRVLADGSREVFVSDDIKVSPFDSWYVAETPAQLAAAEQEIAELKAELAESTRRENANGSDLLQLRRAHDLLGKRVRCQTCFELGKLTYVGTDAGQLAAWKHVEKLIKQLDDGAKTVSAELCEQMIDFFRSQIHTEGMVLAIPKADDEV